jgi:hypothetical protein
VLLLAWRAPPGDDVFVFSIYVAVSVTILVISCVVGLWKSRRRL